MIIISQMCLIFFHDIRASGKRIFPKYHIDNLNFNYQTGNTKLSLIFVSVQILSFELKQ